MSDNQDNPVESKPETENLEGKTTPLPIKNTRLNLSPIKASPEYGILTIKTVKNN